MQQRRGLEQLERGADLDRLLGVVAAGGAPAPVGEGGPEPLAAGDQPPDGVRQLGARGIDLEEQPPLVGDHAVEHRLDAVAQPLAIQGADVHGVSLPAVLVPRVLGPRPSAVDPTTFSVYRGADPRVQFLEDLGFTLAPSVDELDTEETSFYYTLLTEQVDQLTSDVLLSYSETPEDAARMASAPELQAMQQLRQGTVATVGGCLADLVGVAEHRAVAHLGPGGRRGRPRRGLGRT